MIMVKVNRHDILLLSHSQEVYVVFHIPVFLKTKGKKKKFFFPLKFWGGGGGGAFYIIFAKFREKKLPMFAQ